MTMLSREKLMAFDGRGIEDAFKRPVEDVEEKRFIGKPQPSAVDDSTHSRCATHGMPLEDECEDCDEELEIMNDNEEEA